jgi:hypothetical protein
MNGAPGYKKKMFAENRICSSSVGVLNHVSNEGGHLGSQRGHLAKQSSLSGKHGKPGRFWQQKQILLSHAFLVQGFRTTLLWCNVVELTKLALGFAFVWSLLPPSSRRRPVAYDMYYALICVRMTDDTRQNTPWMTHPRKIYVCLHSNVAARIPRDMMIIAYARVLPLILTSTPWGCWNTKTTGYWCRLECGSNGYIWPPYTVYAVIYSRHSEIYSPS